MPVSEKGELEWLTIIVRKRITQGVNFKFETSSEGVVAMLWKDNKGILFLSNFHDIGDDGFVDRKGKGGSKQQISCHDR